MFIKLPELNIFHTVLLVIVHGTSNYHPSFCLCFFFLYSLLFPKALTLIAFVVNSFRSRFHIQLQLATVQHLADISLISCHLFLNNFQFVKVLSCIIQFATIFNKTGILWNSWFFVKIFLLLFFKPTIRAELYYMGWSNKMGI